LQKLGLPDTTLSVTTVLTHMQFCIGIKSGKLPQKGVPNVQ